MTTQSEQDFAEYVLSVAGEPTEPFEPCAFHNTDGDCIEFLVSNTSHHGKYVDNFLTVLLADDTKEIVGAVIDHIQHLCRQFPDAAENGELRLQQLLQRRAETLEAASQDNTTTAGVYRRLAELVAKKRIEPVKVLSV
jgi:hypothetical protein